MTVLKKYEEYFPTDIFFNSSFICCKKRQYYISFEKIWTITHYFLLQTNMLTNNIKNVATLMYQEMELYRQITF